MTESMRRYVKEFSLGMAGYIALLCGSIALLKRVDLGALKYLVVLTPMLPAALLVAAVVRVIGSADELQRKIALDALAIGFGASAVVTFSYGFLEGAGLPHLSWIWVWPVMAVCWMLGHGISRLRYR